uniref:Uncharacterized protein n=1 Tax=Micrurus spixii TaxID=129469 RepID=A0A2D4M1P1_9SAUR
MILYFGNTSGMTQSISPSVFSAGFFPVPPFPSPFSANHKSRARISFHYNSSCLASNNLELIKHFPPSFLLNMWQHFKADTWYRISDASQPASPLCPSPKGLQSMPPFNFDHWIWECDANAITRQLLSSVNVNPPTHTVFLSL